MSAPTLAFNNKALPRQQQLSRMIVRASTATPSRSIRAARAGLPTAIATMAAEALGQRCDRRQMGWCCPKSWHC